MERRHEVVLALSVFLTTAFVVLAYELRELAPALDNSFRAVAVLAGLVLGAPLAHQLIRAAFALKPLRSLVVGRSSIEGAWFLAAYAQGELRACGIIQFTYTTAGEILAQAYYPISVRGSGPYFSTSSSVLLREKDMLYVNYFLAAGSDHEFAGVAVGHFLYNAAGGPPVRYEGKIFYLDGREPARHLGFRLPDREVRAMIAQHGPSRWMDPTIEKHRAAVPQSA